MSEPVEGPVRAVAVVAYLLTNASWSTETPAADQCSAGPSVWMPELSYESYLPLGVLNSEFY